jgi:hypothetical protein
MAIEYNLKIHPVSWLVEQKRDGKLNTDISIQRREVWDYLFKSNLIIAMLHGRSISSLSFEKDSDNIYKVLDGKQRTLTLCSFVEDGFSLSPKVLYKTLGDINLAGLKFSGLPKERQNFLLNYQLSIEVYDPMSEDERDFVFYMGNQSVPLSKVDLLPVVLGETIMEDFKPLCSHPFMANKVRLTPSAVSSRADLKIFVQYLILRSERDMGFSGKEMVSFSDDIKSGEENINADAVLAVLDYIDSAFSGKRAYLKPIHIPTMLYTAQKALEQGIEPQDLGMKFDEFFVDTGKSKDNEYSVACLGGSAKKASVQRRVEYMGRILEVQA